MQLNMLSDPVTNLRRRPGSMYEVSVAFPEITSENTLGWFTDIAGERVHVLLCTATGTVKLLDRTFTQIGTLTSEYLEAADTSKIRAATVGNEFFLCNVGVAPTIEGTTGTLDPTLAGFFYVVAGSFSRAYSVTVADSVGNFTATYTTPGGTGSGDSALATPVYIATQLANQIAAHSARWTVTRVDAYVFVQCADTNTGLTVNSSTGSAYLLPSKDAYMTQAGNLPAQLPAAADGYVCRVGSLETPQYFTYDSARTAWLESGAYGSPAAISGMPVSITKVGGVWELNVTDFEGRLAGDEKSNPAPYFLEFGITGMGTYQGRLALLAGPYVMLSAANKPRRFFRTTITSIVDSDVIAVGSSMNSSAAYEYATAFQKDLVLHSTAYQALIPSGNAAVTPRTATVVTTSTHETDTTSAPVVIGRTMMYPAPKSEDFFGVMEMVPSPYTDSQYVSQDSTPHLPKYFGGRCRFSVASSVANMAIFAPSGDLRSLAVHEYLWDGDQKVQQAWHMWTFPYDVAVAYFALDKIIVGFAQNGTLVLTSIDPKAGVLTFDAGRRPFLDMWDRVTVTDGQVQIPTWLHDFDPTAAENVALTVLSGNLAGDRIGYTVSSSAGPGGEAILETVRSFQNGEACVGIPYRSAFAPSPPVVRDFNEVPISTGKTTLLRYMLGTKNSSEYRVSIRDVFSDEDYDGAFGTLTWSSPELDVGRSRFGTDAVTIIPCRTDATSTSVEVYTEGTGELNVVSLEYIMQYHQKIKRR